MKPHQRAIFLALFALGLLAVAMSYGFAEDAFTFGGYIQRGLVAVGFCIGAIAAFFAGAVIVND